MIKDDKGARRSSNTSTIPISYEEVKCTAVEEIVVTFGVSHPEDILVLLSKVKPRFDSSFVPAWGRNADGQDNELQQNIRVALIGAQSSIVLHDQNSERLSDSARHNKLYMDIVNRLLFVRSQILNLHSELRMRPEILQVHLSVMIVIPYKSVLILKRSR